MTKKCTIREGTQAHILRVPGQTVTVFIAEEEGKILGNLCLENPTKTSSRAYPFLVIFQIERAQQAPLAKALQRIMTLLVYSLLFHGLRIFNALLMIIRDLTGWPVRRFRMKLDNFLQILMNEPSVTCYTGNCRAACNTVLDQMEFKKRDSWDDSSGGPPQLCGTSSRWDQDEMIKYCTYMCMIRNVNVRENCSGERTYM